jgi:hypothetical protein
MTYFYLDSTSVCTAFLFQFDYTSEAAPDSFLIVFSNGYAQCKGGSCGFVYLDDIAFVHDTSLTVPESKELPSINLYPNPTNNILNVENKSGGKVELRLFNSFGKLLIIRTLTNTLTNIELTSLPAGIYFYKLTSKGETFKTGKLIKI